MRLVLIIYRVLLLKLPSHVLTTVNVYQRHKLSDKVKYLNVEINDDSTSEKKVHHLSYGGSGSSVGIATDYGVDGPEIESRRGRDFSHTSRPVLGPTQPPVKWVPGLSRGKAAGAWCRPHHLLLVPRFSKSRAIPLLTL
jgi:hypothetical protein